MLFSKTIKLLSEVKQFSNKEFEKLVDILQSEALLPEHFIGMADNLNNIVNSIPNESYINMIEIVNQFTGELLKLGNLNDDPGVQNEVGFPHLVIVIINLNLAYRLELLGLYGEAHDTLLKAKDPWVTPFDPLTKEGDLYLRRSFDMDLYLLSIVYMLPRLVKEFFVSRAALGFRLSKVMGNVRNESQAAFENYKRFATLVNPTQSDLMFFTNYLDLIPSNSPDATEIINSLINCYSKEKDTNHRFIISSSLAFNLKSLEWTKKAVTETDTFFWAELIYMKVLHLCHAKSIDRDKITKLLWEFMLKAYAIFPDRSMFELLKQKYSIIFTQILTTCLEKREYCLLLELAYNWNGFRPDKQGFQEIKDKDLFLTIPNLEGAEGPIFLIKYSDEIRLVSVKSDVKLEEIMELKSKVEASWYTLVGKDVSLEFQEEAILARQQVEASKEYLSAIESFINIKEFQSMLNELPKETNFEYLETSWTNTAIVPVLLNNTKHTYSITGGNEYHPIPSEIQNVLIWFDPAEDLHRAIFELEGIKKILKKNQVDIEVITGSECTKEGFLERYSDPKYDLIWVISHGEFNSNNPPYSDLTISKTEKITAWELQKSIPKMEKRRYLILNSCYSGCAIVRNNSMGFLGLGSSSANESQIVLGQLWFVDVLAAGVLGILTLESLMNGESLTSSLKSSSLTMSKGNQAIITALNSIDKELQIIERVENTSVMLNLPFYSMSGVVFE